MGDQNVRFWRRLCTSFPRYSLLIGVFRNVRIFGPIMAVYKSTHQDENRKRVVMERMHRRAFKLPQPKKKGVSKEFGLLPKNSPNQQAEAVFF